MGLDRAGQTRAPTSTRRLRNYERAPLHVWELPHAQLKQSHFAAFPPELGRTLPARGLPAGGHVLDPFGGSGKTGAVARAMGMGATLIELNRSTRRWPRSGAPEPGATITSAASARRTASRCCPSSMAADLTLIPHRFGGLG